MDDFEIRTKIVERKVLLKDGSVKTYNIKTSYKCRKNTYNRKRIIHSEDDKKKIINVYTNLQYPNYSQTYNIVKDLYDIETTYHFVRKIILEYLEDEKNDHK